MSHVQEVRYRLRCEQFEQWVERLTGKEPIEPEVVKELAVRLLTVALIILKQHNVNKRGKCKFCGRARRNWRSWIRVPQCAVSGAIGFAMEQELAVVWWRLFGSAGRDVGLGEVRGWAERRTQNTAGDVSGEIAQRE